MNRRKLVLFLINGDKNHPMGNRAEELSRGIDSFDFDFLYRGKANIKNIVRFIIKLIRTPADLIYVFDVGLTTAYPS